MTTVHVEDDGTPDVMLGCVVRRRRTGVIVGIPAGAPVDVAESISRVLAERFPDCVTCVIAGGQSLAFEWEIDQ